MSEGPPTTAEALLRQTAPMLSSTVSDKHDAFIGARLMSVEDETVLVAEWRVSGGTAQRRLRLRFFLDPEALRRGDYAELWNDLDYFVHHEAYAQYDNAVEVIDGEETLVCDWKPYDGPPPPKRTLPGPV